jgi:hypothetical protein
MAMVTHGVDKNKDSIRYHKLIASLQQDLHTGETSEINRRIAWHLIVIKKSTWIRILPEINITAASKNIL